MPMDWRTALLKQAHSDFEMLEFLRLYKQPFCHQLHFLQMATEKLGKEFATAARVNWTLTSPRCCL